MPSRAHIARANLALLPFVAGLMVLALPMISCKKKPEQSAHRLDRGSGSIQVQYKPNVRVLDRREGLAAIQGVSSNGAGILLDTSNQKIASLHSGDVLVIKELTARRIVATEQEGSSVLVLTQPASIAEAVRKGNIHVAAPIRFVSLRPTSGSAGGKSSLLDTIQPVVYASTDGPDSTLDSGGTQQDGNHNFIVNIEGEEIKGWTTDFTATPAEGSLKLHLKMSKTLAGFTALITGDGSIDNFDLDSDIGIDESTTERVETALNNLNGVMNFKWEVGKDTPGVQTGDDEIKLPSPIEIPLYEYLDGFPLFLEIDAALIFKPAISGGKEYSHGAFRITYSGSQHFTVKQGNIDSNGNVTGDIQFLESQNISALAPMGVVVAFAAPRIELTFGLSKIEGLKSDEVSEAAEHVDALTDALAQKALTPDQYQQFKSSPFGDFTMSKALNMATKSEAAAYFEMVSSSGMSFTGASAIVPCTRTDIHLLGKVGASATAFGQNVGGVETTVWSKHYSRVDPPGTRLCEEVGSK